MQIFLESVNDKDETVVARRYALTDTMSDDAMLLMIKTFIEDSFQYDSEDGDILQGKDVRED